MKRNKPLYRIKQSSKWDIYMYTTMNKTQNKKRVKTVYWQNTFHKVFLHNLRIAKLCKIT